MKSAEARELFDGICDEIMFGLNMKIVLANMDGDDRAVIRELIRLCREGRGAK